ncbi:MAG: MBL fold metallo-hydrolase [Neisseria sp.]|uniref:MBL fold metallo-hydrolase n=1 Tax=Neisseria sp. TaxID=192066 RepID=UPI0026DD6463|nr:MBL fold metallo-hydrolase [Neisseria sp.]MDO4640767.1 MBL fold metallo-hydrolase [Neisseria sp.]
MKHAKKLIASLFITSALAYFLMPDTYPAYPTSDHYNPQTGLFYNPEPQRPVKDVASAMWRMLTDKASTRPPETLPMVKPDWSAFLAAGAKSRFIWFGHSTLLMRIGNQTVITDPVFGKYASPVPIMMRRFQAPPAGLNELPPLDAVLISHNHYDHLEKSTVKYLAAKNNHFIVSLGLGVLLEKWGVPRSRITELDWWQSTERNGIIYTAVPARHDSGRGLNDRHKTLWSGFVIEHDQERFYYSADSSYGKHFDAIAARFSPVDIAFVENGQYNERWPDNHMFPEQTVEVAAKFKPKRFMPIHWGAYPLALHSWNEPVLRSIPLARKLGLNPLTPLQGQIFDTDTATEDWFAKP